LSECGVVRVFSHAARDVNDCRHDPDLNFEGDELALRPTGQGPVGITVDGDGLTADRALRFDDGYDVQRSSLTPDR
jgi:hypothetical protein